MTIGMERDSVLRYFQISFSDMHEINGTVPSFQSALVNYCSLNLVVQDRIGENSIVSLRRETSMPYR